MRCLALLFLCLCALRHPLLAAPPAVRPVQTMDQSHQLLVQGGTFAQRAAVLRLASELRDTLLKALFLSEESYPIARPIIFDLNPNQPPEVPADFQVLEDPGGIKLRVRMPPLEPEVSPRSETTVAGIKLSIHMPLPETWVSPQIERTILSALVTEIAFTEAQIEEGRELVSTRPLS